MNINIKLDRNFTTMFNRLSEEYGTEMAALNGFAEEQLSYTDFIDHFVDKQTVADASIDGNANVGRKDIVSLENEMNKPHSKLLAFNKIYHELNKKYGFSVANAWLRGEWNGEFYVHDAPSSSYRPYCVMPQECCVFILDGKFIHTSLEDIYKTVSEKEWFDKDAGVKIKRPKNLMVLDYDRVSGKSRYTKVVAISQKQSDKNFRFIKAHNGANLITTEDHQYISNRSDIEAKNLVPDKDVLYSIYDDKIFTNSVHEYNGLKLTADLGWLVGMYLAEGYEQSGQLSICQNSSKSPEEYKRIIALLDELGIPYREFNKHGDVADVVRLKNGDYNWEKRLKKIWSGRYCNEKALCHDYIHFNDDFLKGILAGIIDGDGTIAKNKTVMIRMTSRTLINQIREIGLHFGVFFGSRLPYIQSQNAKIRQDKPMYSANVNMNRNREFFLSLNSRKTKELFTDFEYNEVFANKNYTCTFGEILTRDNSETYKPSATVYDLSTESNTFVCNNILVHNCFAYDIEELVNRGLFFIEGFNAQPPKHLVTYTDFVVEFVSWTCNRSSGAVGLPQFLLYAYYFWKKDCDAGYYIRTPEYYRDQECQRVVYKINQPYVRDGVQSAFTNFTIFDRPYLESLFGGKMFPNGEFIIDHIDGILEYQKAFMKIAAEVRAANVMTFPVLTVALLRENGEFVDQDSAKYYCEHNMKWADSNFFISSSVNSLSNCCRLKSNIEDLGYYNSIGGTALEVGSVKVNTINLARIAYEAKTEQEYLEVLKDRVVLCCQALDIVRGIISRNIEKGLLPNYSLNIMHLDSQYNTIGIIGIYEALQKFKHTKKDKLGYTSYTDAGIAFATKILATINETKKAFAEDKDYMINIEQIPGERAAYVLMQKDKFIFPKEKYELPLYGNQWIPLGVKTTLKDKIAISAVLDEACSGGSIAHINIDAPFNSFDTAWKMLNYVADAGVEYFAFNLKISACEKNHGFYGDTCPQCGGEVVTTYQRIVGFLVPEKTYSKERKAEFKLRDWFDINGMQEI